MDRRESDHWHIDRTIPLSIILVLAAQTFGGVWFAASYVAKIDTLSTLVAELRASLYSKEDSLRDKELQLVRLDELMRRVDQLEGNRRHRE